MLSSLISDLGLDRPLLYAARKLLYLWVRTQTLPESAPALGLATEKQVVYVLQRRFLPNLLVLSRETRSLGLPSPLKSTRIGEGKSRSFFFLARPEPWFGARKPSYSPLLRNLVAQACHDPAFDIQLVPVTILWGRAPDKENSIWQLLFSDGWANRGSLKQMLTVLFHGRQTLVRFNEPMSLRQVLEDATDEEIALRKVSRVLRGHFRRQREAAIGPDLSHRRTRLNELLASERVRLAIDAEAQENGGTPAARRKAEKAARACALEIAADYSYPMVRVLDRLLAWLWTRLYDGVEVRNFDTVSNIAPGHSIVYVPSHRSHIDYLLLSYIVFRQGLMPPHIAAGANLNLPVVGGILRRGGAFFLRRSFKGNKLYGAVFNEYLHMMITKGYSIEYFVEGGRSRTGRMLAPMAGMLAMTVQSYLREAARPIVFVPVYIGYEKLFEGRTYIGELMGQPKKKESLLALLLTVRELKKNFGKVHLNFGEPIRLAEVLAAHNPQWQHEIVAPDERPEWLVQAVRQLSRGIVRNINAAAVAGPVNLVSLALLATPRHAMDEDQLVHLLDAYRKLAALAAYSQRIEITAMDGKAMVAWCEQLQLVQRQHHPLGDVLYFTQEDAVLSTYARNNVLHLFALPALIACLATRNANLKRADIMRLAQTVYPFLRNELFLRWGTDELEELEQAVATSIDALVAMQWLKKTGDDNFATPYLNSDAYVELSLLAQAMRPTLIRYFITIAMLTQRGSGTITPEELESLCHLQAQRLSLLREFNAPEFFDKAIFRSFIETLKQTGYAQVSEDGMIHYDGQLVVAANEARFVLPPDVRQTVLHMTRIGVRRQSFTNAAPMAPQG